MSGVLPPLAEGDRLELKALRPEQKFTQPPPRFTEATLVKELEENGIGRPSTYASIIGVLQDREYVNKIEGRFKPSALGVIIADLLTKSFDDIIDVEYTRSLEEDLDKIEQGKTDYVKTLTSFYKKFKKDLARAGKEMHESQEGHRDRRGLRQVRRADAEARSASSARSSRAARIPSAPTRARSKRSEPESETGEEEIEPCENCGKPMAVKRGRFGQFLACTGYPGVQDDAEADRHQAGRAEGRQAGSDPRREMPALRRRTWSSSRAASASSPRAPTIPSASTSSTRRPA